MSEDRSAGEELLRTGVIVPVRIVEEAVMPGADESAPNCTSVQRAGCDPSLPRDQLADEELPAAWLSTPAGRPDVSPTQLPGTAPLCALTEGAARAL